MLNAIMESQKGLIPAMTWAQLSAISPVGQAGRVVRVTDVGINGSTWISDGTKWSPVAGVVVLAQSNLAIPSPANTSENIAVAKTIQGGLLGDNGNIKVEYLFTTSNSPNNKAIRIKCGASILAITNQTTNATGQGAVTIRNDNNPSSQKSFSSGVVTISTSALNTSSIDTAQDFVVSIATILANASDTLSIDGHSIILYRN